MDFEIRRLFAWFSNFMRRKEKPNVKYRKSSENGDGICSVKEQRTPIMPIKDNVLPITTHSKNVEAIGSQPSCNPKIDQRDESGFDGKENQAPSRSWERLIRDVTEFSNELLEMDSENEEDIHTFVQYALDRIDMVLERNGATAIDEEKTFDLLRDSPVPPRSINDGTAITKILRRGWALNGTVLRRALVSVKVDDEDSRQMESAL